VIGLYTRSLPEGDLKRKYREYCQIWQERKEIEAEISIKRSYKYDGISYWAECLFVRGKLKGSRKIRSLYLGIELVFELGKRWMRG